MGTVSPEANLAEGCRSPLRVQLDNRATQVQPTRRPYSPSRCYGTEPRRCRVARCSRSPDTFSGWPCPALNILLLFSRAWALEPPGSGEASVHRPPSPPAYSPSLSSHWPSKASIMDPSNILTQLRGFDKASPQFHEDLSNFLRSEGYRSAVPSLQTEDLAWLVEYLDSVSLQTISP